MDIRGWCHVGHRRGGVMLDIRGWCHVGHRRGGVMLDTGRVVPCWTQEGWCHVGHKRVVSCWT